MKVKTVSRSSDTYVPVRNTQESALPRNLDPALHPFERAREYTKALTATKMERMFAKPFVGQLGDGHRDGVYQVAKNFASTSQVASASADGVIKYWDMTLRRETVSFKAHYGMVSGLCVTPSQGHVMLCGDDKTVKMWLVRSDEIDADGRRGLVKTFLGEHAFKGVDHHQHEGMFVTGGALVQLWDVNRLQYVSNLSWGADNVTNVKFNRTQTNVVALTGSDNSIVLYDVRTNSAVQKVVTSMRTNAVAWNPMEAFNFASALEDHNAYLWDMRRLDRLLNVYKDHVAAVMDVDFLPTGEELVTGSYDKTVRIFGARQGHLRDIYHTKRMQHVFCVRFLTDARYILSGSDDANVRVWRANAAATASVKSSRQRAKLEYDAALKERFKHMPEIRRIAKHRHVPIVVKKAAEIKRVETEALRKRQDNQRRHSKPGAVPYEAERQRHIRGTAIKE
jgi:WD repeat and SOF domain-containing protein 1